MALASLIYAIFLAPVGGNTDNFALIVVLLFTAGVGSGVQTAFNSYTGTIYPTLIRPTGLGWGIGIGRIGSILGPLFGAATLSWQWQLTSIFHVAAIPAVISAGCLIGLGFVLPRSSALATRKNFTSASGKTTVPMSRPSITRSPNWMQSRCVFFIQSRTLGIAAIREVAELTSAVRISLSG